MIKRALLFLLATATLTAASVTHDIEFVRRGASPLALDASVPDGSGPYAAVIIVHGGGFARGNKVTYVTPMFQPLTDANLVWFTIDYRLTPASHLPDPVDDVISALRWVHEHAAQYKVDPKRVALLGESAGAYLVDYAAMIAPKELPIAAVVSFYGPHDLVLQAKVKGLSAGLRDLTGARELDPAGAQRLREVSPYFMVRRGLPPFLLLHGTADEQVPYQQSPRFCAALEAQGNACELYTVDGGRHGMGQWEEHAGQLAYKRVVIDWLKKTLR